MRLKILTVKEKNKIEEKLFEQFGVERIPGILVMRGAERLFLYQGSMSVKEILDLDTTRINIERVGVYFGKEQNDKIRLSIEGAQILRPQITKNIFELTKEQAEEWMKGRELNIVTGKKDFLIMEYNGDFLGCGKASAEKISNYIPKNRRLKEKG